MPTETSSSEKLRVIVVGGGVAALETVLALQDLAGELADVSVVAPNSEFHYRPMTVREPFSQGQARRYPLAPIVSDAGASLICDELAWVDPENRIVHTKSDEQLEYDALVLAMGARANARPLPLYELALMTAGRAYDMNMDVAITLVTPEDSPLAIFGQTVSSAVAERLARSKVQTIHSAYAEVHQEGEVVINPGDRRLHVDRVVALPELYGPCVRGIPLSEHGFLRVNPYGRVLAAEGVYAAGDCTEFPVKHGGVGAQQADVVAQSIAAKYLTPYLDAQDREPSTTLHAQDQAG